MKTKDILIILGIAALGAYVVYQGQRLSKLENGDKPPIDKSNSNSSNSNYDGIPNRKVDKTKSTPSTKN